MLLIGISTLWIALILFFFVFLGVYDRIAVLRGVLKHLLLCHVRNSLGAVEDLLAWETNDLDLYNHCRYFILNSIDFSRILEKTNALGNNNSHFSPDSAC